MKLWLIIVLIVWFAPVIFVLFLAVHQKFCELRSLRDENRLLEFEIRHARERGDIFRAWELMKPVEPTRRLNW